MKLSLITKMAHLILGWENYFVDRTAGGKTARGISPFLHISTLELELGPR